MFGVAIVYGIKQSQLQVSLLSTCQGWVMTAMSLSQFMFGVVAVTGIKQSQLQVSLVLGSRLGY